MRFTKSQPLLIGEANGVLHHVLSTGTAMGYDIDLYEEAWITGSGAQAEINRGLFMLVDDTPSPDPGLTTFGVTFDSPGASAEVAPPVQAVNPNVAPDPTLEPADSDGEADEEPVAEAPKRRGGRQPKTPAAEAVVEGDD